MRSFKDGDVITVEPFRASAFPLIKDLVVDRSAFDKIQQSGGYISVRTGAAPDANSIPVPKGDADLAMDAAIVKVSEKLQIQFAQKLLPDVEAVSR